MSTTTKDKVTKLSQLHASDMLKRRWPNRYIAQPILGVDECVAGLIEIGALSQIVIDESTKKIALIHWMLSRIEVKPKKDSFGEKFYSSGAWRKLRFSVLKQSNGLCKMCGTSSKEGARMHVDHIKPRSKFPELALDPTNMQVLCEDCNVGKSDIEY